MRLALKENRDSYKKLMRARAKQIAVDAATGKVNPMTKVKALNQLGSKAVGDIQRMIASSVPPENAPSTVRQKGSSTTLVDTGELRQRVMFKLED